LDNTDRAKKTNTTAAKKENIKVKKASPKKRIPKVNFKELFKNRSFIAILILLAAFGLGMLLRGVIIAASVNGIPITRCKVIKQLESTQGKTTLEALVNEALVQQELKKQNINVPQEEIDAQMKEIEDSISSSGQDLEELLEMQGLTRQQLESDIKTQLGAEKLLSDKVEVTDEEVAEYIETNVDMFPEDLDTTTEEFNTQVKESLRQQKLTTEFSTWLQAIKDTADIKYYVDY